MNKQQKIVFKKYMLSTALREKKLNASLGQLNLKGDFISDPPGLDEAYSFSCSIVSELEKQRNDKYLKSFKVIRGDKGVYVMRTNIVTTEAQRFCGFELITNPIVQS